MLTYYLSGFMEGITQLMNRVTILLLLKAVLIYHVKKVQAEDKCFQLYCAIRVHARYAIYSIYKAHFNTGRSF